MLYCFEKKKNRSQLSYDFESKFYIFGLAGKKRESFFFFVLLQQNLKLTSNFSLFVSLSLMATEKGRFSTPQKSKKELRSRTDSKEETRLSQQSYRRFKDARKL